MTLTHSRPPLFLKKNIPNSIGFESLHYDPQLATMPCEAAYISMPSAESIRLKDIKNSMVPVTVLVA